LGLSGFSGTIGASGPQGVSGVSGYSGLAASPFNDSIDFILDGGGAPIPTGLRGYFSLAFPCEILQVTMVADAMGSIQVDIWKSTYATFPPDIIDSIVAGNYPTISSAQKSQDLTLTGWDTTLNAGDILAFYVLSTSCITNCTISLKVMR